MRAPFRSRCHARACFDRWREALAVVRIVVLVGVASASCATIAGLDQDFVLGSTAAEQGGAATTSSGAGAIGQAGEGAVAASPPGGAGGAGAGSGAGTSSGGSGGGQGGSGGNPLVDVAVSLAGFRVELPCGSSGGSVPCDATSAQTTRTAGGDPSHVYQITLRVRGVVEQNEYAGGTGTGRFYTGGAPLHGGWNIHSIEIDDPPEKHFVNAGAIGILYCFAIDYPATIRVRGGSTIHLKADGIDGVQVRNIDSMGNPIVVPDIPPAPDPFDGQFFQLDVSDVEQLGG